jgi:hypothetical protein
MTVGYQCENHGIVKTCDYDESGDRICKKCGSGVTSIEGTTRQDYEERPDVEGLIEWVVEYETGEYVVEAFDFDEAGNKLLAKRDVVVRSIEPN